VYPQIVFTHHLIPKKMKNTITLPKKFIYVKNCSIDFSLCFPYVKAQTKAYTTTLCLLLFSFASFAQTFTVSGKVNTYIENHTYLDEPPKFAYLKEANISLKGTTKGVVTDANGYYKLIGVEKGTYTLVCSYVGYQTKEKIIEVNKDLYIDFAMEEEFSHFAQYIVYGQKTPLPFTREEISKADLQKQNLGQDLPILLNFTPSIVTTTDAGAGVGYTGMRIRGSDATRTNVTINGIPVNDAESQGVFWVNMPDFASSVSSVQIQRGVGTSVNGAGAFGATVNLETARPQDQAYAEIGNSYGSFNTWKNNVQFGTGLIKNKFKLDGRLSRITSDGFIDRASSNLRSFFVAGEFDAGKAGTFTTNIFSGKEITYQAWEGVPESRLRGNKEEIEAYINRNFLNDRAANHLRNANSRTFNPYTYENQVDDYQQDHYQFLHKLNVGNFRFNSALFYTKGRGFFEQFRENDRLSSYNLPNVVVGGETIKNTDLIRRRWLDNDFYGFVTNMTYATSRIEAILGGGYNVYQGKHFGEVIWARYASTGNIRHRYYDNDATKTDANVYAKANFRVIESADFWAFADMQIRNVSYKFLGYDTDKRNVTQTDNLTFFNPKLGVRYNANNEHDFYASYAVANREPNRNDYTESTTNSRPKHETLHNIEAGYSWNKGKFLLAANVYYMLYKNQLVVTGKLNDVGSAVRQNTPDSYRTGLELQANWFISNKLKWNLNATFSQNKIASYTEYLDNYDTGEQQSFTYKDTDIAFSPSVVAASQFTVSPTNWFNVALLTKYVGKQYLDNTQNESRKLNDYLTNDLHFNFIVKPKFMKEINVSFLANNIFSTLYESNGYTFGYIAGNQTIRENFYYPQAGFNWLGQVVVKF
jgi:iron complex outermembrane receptor protein